MLAQYSTGPKTFNQTPRHSSTKHIKKEGTINSKVEHWDYTTWEIIWDCVKKRKERTSKAKKFFCLKKKKKNPKVLKILKFIGNKIDWDCKILKGNSEKQENSFVKQFSREFIDRRPKVAKYFYRD